MTPEKVNAVCPSALAPAFREASCPVDSAVETPLSPMVVTPSDGYTSSDTTLAPLVDGWSSVRASGAISSDDIIAPLVDGWSSFRASGAISSDDIIASLVDGWSSRRASGTISSDDIIAPLVDGCSSRRAMAIHYSVSPLLAAERVAIHYSVRLI